MCVVVTVEWTSWEYVFDEPASLTSPEYVAATVQGAAEATRTPPGTWHFAVPARWFSAMAIPLAQKAWEPSEPVSVNVTLPVGSPVAGATGATVATKLTGLPDPVA